MIIFPKTRKSFLLFYYVFYYFLFACHIMKHKSAQGLPSDNGWRKTPRWFHFKKNDFPFFTKLEGNRKRILIRKSNLK